jgi:hypothetical protein
MWSATALVASNMIGTGIFTATGFPAGNLVGLCSWRLDREKHSKLSAYWSVTW